MRCPECAATETKVIDSRINQSRDITRRRRQCEDCDARFTTYERIEEIMPSVVKKDGRREEFSRQKVIDGINKACGKRSVPAQSIEEVVHKIERRIQGFGVKEVPSKTIGQLVMTELLKIDQVAYVRFASVYKEFREIEEFVADLKEPPVTGIDNSTLSFPFSTEAGEAGS